MTEKTNRDKILDLRATDPTVRAVMLVYEAQADAAGGVTWLECMESLVIRLAQEKDAETLRAIGAEAERLHRILTS